MKTTPWFDAAIDNPEHVGVYEVNSCTGYSYWDGRRWNGCWLTVAWAYDKHGWGAGIPVRHWRGLVVKP